jgi:uncharacterized protein (DUF1697 family)
LLRGINVGGKNLIRKGDLVACFEKLGLRDVTTFIQSGNVLFTARDSGQAALTRRIEKALESTFGSSTNVVLRSRRQMQSIVGRAPEAFGSSSKYRWDVIFLKEPLTAAKALALVPVKDGVDAVHSGPGVLYCARLAAKASQSRLSRIALLPEYRSMTIRNFNTTSKLLALLAD